MRSIAAIIGLAVTFTACNSNKSTEKETTVKTDSVTPVNDTPVPLPPADIAKPEPGILGDLSLDMTADAVVRSLGEASTKSKAEEWGADGLMHQDWNYPTKGLVLNMSSEKDISKQVVFSISATAPSTLKTARNVGIGSSYKEVWTAYEKEVDKEVSDKAVIVIGSLYGGIIFNFKNDKVEKMFVGAAAE